MNQHFSRSQWSQIIKRSRLAKFVFDPKWKCLVCGTQFRRCFEHTAEENELVAAEARTRFEKISN